MTEQETDLRDPRVLQQRWAGVGARFHIQDLWLYVAATVLVALLFVAAACLLPEVWGSTLSSVRAVFSRHLSPPRPPLCRARARRRRR